MSNKLLNKLTTIGFSSMLVALVGYFFLFNFPTKLIHDKINKIALPINGSKIKVNELNCYYFGRTECSIDFSINNMNSELTNFIGDFTIINGKIANFKLNTNISKDILKKLLIGIDKESSDFNKISMLINKNLILSGNVNGNDYSAKVENNFIKIKTIANVEKVVFKDKTHIIKNKEGHGFILPNIDYRINNITDSFEIKDKESFKLLVYNIYKLNYDNAIDKTIINKYLFDINTNKLFNKEDFDKLISKYMLKFKTQKAGYLKVVLIPISNAYLGGELKKQEINNKPFLLLEIPFKFEKENK